MFRSAFLNPSVPPPPPHDPVIQGMSVQQLHPAVSAMASPVGTIPQVATAESILTAANFDLQLKLEKSNEKIKALENEQTALLDRLEKALVIASRLKNVEQMHNELKDRYAASERELRSLFSRNKELEIMVQERGNHLTDVRNKYLNERERSAAIASELENARTVSELAKRELDNQVERTSLRDIQISTLRSLAESGAVMPSVTAPSLFTAKSLAEVRVSGDDELNMASTMSAGGLKPTSWKEWQLTPHIGERRSVTQHTRRLLLSKDVVGTLFEDKCVRLSVSVSITASVAMIDFALTNTSPAVLQNVRILNATRSNSYFDFTVEQATELFLRPGQHTACRAEMRLVGVFDFQNVQPTICVTYTQPGDVPKSVYVAVPLHAIKFASPVAPDASALLNRWTALADNEEARQVRAEREDVKSFSNIVTLGQLGGSLMPIRGVDPNPRGQVFAAIVTGDKEIVARLELTPADHRGPPMIRVTVRSASLSLSKSVVSSLIDVLA